MLGKKKEIQEVKQVVVPRDGDYKNLIKFMSSHKKNRIVSFIGSEVSQADVNLTNLKYLIPNAVANGLVGVPQSGYADQSMLDNDDLVGSYLDNAERTDPEFFNNLSKEKTEKKENEKAPEANENNSQGTSEGGLA